MSGFFPLVGKAYYCAGILKRLFHRKNEKMWKRQEFQEEKENTGCEEIKRVKKNETTKQRKRNVTITGRNVQL